MKVYTVIPGRLYQRGHTRRVSYWPDVQETLETLQIGAVVCLAGKPDVVVSHWLRRRAGLYLYAPIPDGKVQPARMDELVRALLPTLQAERAVLVHCHAGRNRASLLSALLLRELLGISGIEAVDRIRAIRPNALANPHFVAYLESKEALPCASSST